MTLPDKLIYLLDIQAAKQQVSQEDLITRYCKEGLKRDADKEKKKKAEWTPGQKAKIILDWWCAEYPKLFNGEKYQVVGGRDMKHLTGIFKTTPDMTGDDIRQRLRRFAADKSQFYRGHPLSKFNPNEWTTEAIATKALPQKKTYTQPRTGLSPMALSEANRKHE